MPPRKPKTSVVLPQLFASLPEQLPPMRALTSKDWSAPKELPNLSHESEVAIDIETRDDTLSRGEGPGYYAYEKGNPNTGYICGISVAWRDQAVYIPLRHYGEPICFNPNNVGPWLADLAKQDHTRFVFHNFQYDWGWINTVFGTKPPSQIDDTMAMASMVDENRFSFGLDKLCEWQGLPGKDEGILIEALTDRKVKNKNVKQSIWRLPAGIVGPYAEQDARSTLQLFYKLLPLLAKEEVEAAYQIERELFPVTLKMKQHGIRVDKDKAEYYADHMSGYCIEDMAKLSDMLGEEVSMKEIRSNEWLKRVWDQHGITPKYPNTSLGRASFDKVFMANHPHDIPKLIYQIKHTTDLANKFLKTFICEYAYKGRVYPTVNQFRSEGGGARSHRFSYSDPPLQQMPSRDEKHASDIRSCFLPEDGEFWCSIDWRQQEYRLIVYTAERIKARGAKEAADRYRRDPDTDFHDYVAKITGLGRKRAKDTNFAKAYGAGVPKFASMIGKSIEEAAAIYEQYDNELPFVREASDRYTRAASNQGFIRLIDGARGHFNLWEPREYRDFSLVAEKRKLYPNEDMETYSCPYEQAIARTKNIHHLWYGAQLRRSFTHKAFNRMIQGSAARQIKKAMVDIVKTGYQPVLQLHDELCFSFSSETDAKRCAEIMEHAVPSITIPMLTDVKIGSSWGDLEK